jgi:hypothetical protein
MIAICPGATSLIETTTMASVITNPPRKFSLTLSGIDARTPTIVMAHVGAQEVLGGKVVERMEKVSDAEYQRC